MSGLEQQLNSLVAGKSADVGIAALDLKSGETVSIRGDAPFPMASTVKVAVAALYLAQVDHGRRSLDDTIGGFPVRSLMARMIIHSDNRATDIIFKDLGGPSALHDWLSDNGVSGLRVDRTIAQLLERQARPVGPPRFRTPHAMVDLLEADLPGRVDQAGEPQLPARPDEPLRDRQEPDEGAASERHVRSSTRPAR